MTTYLKLWMVAAAAVGCCGAVLCFALVSPGIWIVMGVVAGCAAHCSDASTRRWARERGLPRLDRDEHVALSVAAVTAVQGLVAFLPLLAVLTILVLGASALPFALVRTGPRRDLRWLRRVLPHMVVADESPSSAPGPTRPATTSLCHVDEMSEKIAPVLARWSDEQLCHAWRASFTRLRADDIDVLAAVAWERQLYLDELERRCPQGFECWMKAHPRAASDPTRFMRRGETRS